MTSNLTRVFNFVFEKSSFTQFSNINEVLQSLVLLNSQIKFYYYTYSVILIYNTNKLFYSKSILTYLLKLYEEISI